MKRKENYRGNQQQTGAPFTPHPHSHSERGVSSPKQAGATRLPTDSAAGIPCVPEGLPGPASRPPPWAEEGHASAWLHCRDTGTQLSMAPCDVADSPLSFRLSGAPCFSLSLRYKLSPPADPSTLGFGSRKQLTSCPGQACAASPTFLLARPTNGGSTPGGARSLSPSQILLLQGACPDQPMGCGFCLGLIITLSSSFNFPRPQSCLTCPRRCRLSGGGPDGRLL